MMLSTNGGGMLLHSFVLHRVDDSVGVAIRDLEPKEQLVGTVFGGDGVIQAIEIVEPIPFGHKVAAVPISKGDDVVEYGVPIGRALADIAPGQLVHILNLGSVRWAR